MEHTTFEMETLKKFEIVMMETLTLTPVGAVRGSAGFAALVVVFCVFGKKGLLFLFFVATVRWVFSVERERPGRYTAHTIILSEYGQRFPVPKTI